MLREAREAANMTQQELAQKLRRPQSYVAKVEGGERRLDVVELLAIAGAVGFDPIKVVRQLQKVR